jgi:ABC-type dipeptide/oligopeptide/nickel transport system ATPase component
MPQAPCPFCFRKINTSRLAYQCMGRGVTRCTKEADPLRVELTGNLAETYPTFDAPAERGRAPHCPTCGFEAKRRACPACHTALPISFVDSKSPMIGLIGSTGSGKTVMMTVLVKQLREKIARQFDASIRLTTDSTGDIVGGIETYKTAREDALFEQGRLPTKTNPASSIEIDDQGTVTGTRRAPLILEWQGRKSGAFGRSSVETTILSFLDTAGEQFGSLEETYGLDYIAACDCLIVALDPFSIPGARARLNLPEKAVITTDGTPLQVVERVTEMLRVELGVKNKKKIKVPLAAVFTKIDAFYPSMDRGNPIMNPPGRLPAYQEHDGEAVHEQMRALLHEWNAADIDSHLSYNWDTFRYFGVSSLGAEPDYTNERAADGGIRPHRVEDPLLWLLSKKGAVRAQ